MLRLRCTLLSYDYRVCHSFRQTDACCGNGFQPTGSRSYINGDKMGQTPLQLSLKADKSYTVEFRIPGKQPIIRIINNRVEAK